MPVALTIDPGQSTGWAVWSLSDWNEVNPPLAAGIATARGRSGWEDASLELADWFTEFIRLREVKLVGCEFPQIFNDAAGHIGATQQVPTKLAYLVGMYAGICHGLKIGFRPIPVREWKGQLNKDIVKQRIEKLLGKKRCEGFRADAWDAVGIGLWMKGCL